jgi:RNA-dependent RNA polymerase
MLRADHQPTFWNTYRWVFLFDRDEVEKLRACAAKLRLLAEDDQDLDIMSTSGQTRYFVEKLSSTRYDEQYGEPELKALQFAPRCLIEGLIAHGILRPGDVHTLILTLNAETKNIGAKCRVLESLYNEERIRDVQRCVRSTFC